jgi:hypothetical protein
MIREHVLLAKVETARQFCFFSIFCTDYLWILINLIMHYIYYYEL